MGIDIKQYRSPATKGEVAGIAIDVSLALSSIQAALLKIRIAMRTRDEADLDQELSKLRDLSSGLDKKFDELTGYKPDGD